MIRWAGFNRFLPWRASRWPAILCCSAVLAAAGCQKFNLGGSAVIKKGSNVKMHYTLTVDGQVMDSSTGREPLAFVQGSGQIIPGLEAALEGLKTGEKKQVTVAPEQGYGVRDDRAIQKVPKTAFDNAAGLKVGSVVSGQAGNRPFQAVVTAISAKEITLDLNHPLAGKTLNFAIEIVEVKGS
ncbi:MAG: peptidylprolyl isomerase [Elusimicrobia bacterium]|nr:peptidylprolyl isomerase [Elusimicrobiota bacterium]